MLPLRNQIPLGFTFWDLTGPEPKQECEKYLHELETRKLYYSLFPSKMPFQLDERKEQQFNQTEKMRRNELLQLCQTQGFVFRHKQKHSYHGTRSRVSPYRGISCNGIGWKVQFQIKTRQVYLCTLTDQHTAARLYDVCSIQRRGTRAKTNFNYYFQDVVSILHGNRLGT